MNGVFDGDTKKSLRDFMGWETYDERIRTDDPIDLDVLADIRRMKRLVASGRAAIT